MTNHSSDAVPEGRQLIQEGTVSMLYPKDVVFYNPVQVQNRDLSTLMITLFGERRVKRAAIRAHRKKLNKEFKAQSGKPANACNREEMDAKLKAFEDSFQFSEEEAKKMKGMRILDALAASGLRSLRYHKEIPSALVHSITINDLDPAAVDLAKENIEYNKLSDALVQSPQEEVTKGGIWVQLGDATQVLYNSRRPPNLQTPTQVQALQRDQYDVIDLDPYGSAAPFIDGAVQAISNGGLLLVTCTDMAALGGSHPETCYGRYGSMPITRVGYLQELAVRILLGNLAQRAAVYGRTIRPILSVGMNFYIRVFVEVWDDKAGVNTVATNIGTVYQSTQCPSFYTVPHGNLPPHKNIVTNSRAPPHACPETGGGYKTAGPAWLGPLHDFAVVEEAIERLEPLLKHKEAERKRAKVASKKKEEENNGDNTTSDDTTNEVLPTPEFSSLATASNIHGLLTVVSEELPDAPLYYRLPDLCHVLSCPCPPMKSFQAAIINAGYKVSSYHKEAQAIKTNAPNEVVWDVLREWCKEHPPKVKSKKKENRKRKRRKNDNEKAQPEQDGDGNDVENDGPSMTTGQKILAKDLSIKVDFTIPKSLANGKKKAVRFPMNPESNWGPKKAASGYKRKHEESNEQNDE